MTIVSKKMQRIPSSPTAAMSDRARALKEKGQDVIRLSSGESDFDVEEFVEQAAIDAIKAHKTRPSAVAGSPDVRKAVQLKFKRDNGLDYDLDEIIVSNGGKQILYSALFATVDPGDEVIIPAPYWVSYPHMVTLADGEPVFVACDHNANFKLRPEQLEEAITPKTKWMILNTPSNPSGAVYTKAELEGIAEVLRRHPHVWVMCDDIYEHLIYDGAEHHCLAAVAPDLKDRIVTMNGMSKGFAMSGWRVGFAGAPKELVKAMVRLHSHSAMSMNVVSQEATAAGLNGDQSFLKRNAEDFRKRRDIVVAALDRCPGIHCHKPDGAFYVYPNIAGCIGKTAPSGKPIETDEDFVRELLDTEGVAVVHGGAFGLSPYFRVSYASALPELEEACRRIERFCTALK
ncbi:MAG: pyridoxal phosphate-dependent aminotransferase [Acetobacterales bacterium]